MSETSQKLLQKKYYNTRLEADESVSVSIRKAFWFVFIQIERLETHSR